MPQFDRERFVPATCTHSRFGKRGTLLAVDCKKGLSSCKLTVVGGQKYCVFPSGVPFNQGKKAQLDEKSIPK